MDILSVAALSLAPGIFWMYFFYKRDKLAPEPVRLVLKTFLLGMLMVLPAIIAERPFNFSKLVLLVFIAPPVEEFLKFTVVRIFVYRKIEFNEPMDGIIYSISVSLGFATAENAYFIISSYMAPQIALGMSDPVWAFGLIWKLYLIRAFLTVPGHALWSAMWGYALGMSKFLEAKSKSIIIKGLILSCVLHGLFNLMLLNFPPGAVGMLILVPAMWYMVHRRMLKAVNDSPFNDKND